MFNNLNQNQNSAEKNVDDIFEETDKVAHDANNIEAHPAGLAAQAGELDAVLEEEPKEKNKIKMILILGLAIIILAAAVYLVYSKLMNSAADNNLDGINAVPVNNNELATPQNTAEPEDNNVIAPQIEDEEEIVVSPEPEDIAPAPGQPIISTPQEIDSDADGLTDDNEANLGTNPLLPDSDGDGLTDREELMIYNTDPLNPDSDGDGLTDYEEIGVYGTDPLVADSDADGYSDGEEVANGYNPLGEGLLQ